jgi:hypothetical protein
MRNDVPAPTLFDDLQNQTIEDVAWECAQQILAIRPTARIVPGATNAFAEDLLRWCDQERTIHERTTDGRGLRTWSREEQMRWLVHEVRDQCQEPPPSGQLRSMLQGKFRPELRDPTELMYENWKANSNCKHCVDSGKLLPGERLRLNAPDEFCVCGAGEARRNAKRRLQRPH